MTLSEWFEQTGRKKGEFAAAIDVTPQMISAYCSGSIWPSRERMRAIEKETGGAVKADSFVWLGVEAGAA